MDNLTPQYIDLPLPDDRLHVPDSASPDYRAISEKTIYRSGMFNGRKFETLREITVSGMQLVWDYSAANKPLRLLNDQQDIVRINIVADSVRIDMPLKFPQAEVNIYARELKFSDDGSIDITPLDYSAPADPGERVQTDNGVTGLPGGDGGDAQSINLNVEVLRIPKPEDGTAPVLFFANGANGQAGGEGGYLSLPDGAVPSPAGVSWSAVYETLSNTKLGTIPFGIPTVRVEEHTGPGAILTGVIRQLSLNPLKQCPPKLQNVCALHYDIVVHFPPGYFYHTNWSVKHGDPDVVPANGADAYPYGRPGDGGDGGEVKLTGDIHWSESGESCGIALGDIVQTNAGQKGSAEVQKGGEPSDLDFARVAMEISFAEEKEKPNKLGLPQNARLPKTLTAYVSELDIERDKVTPKPGTNADPETVHDGKSGKTTQLTQSDASWCRAFNAEAALAYSRCAFWMQNRDLAREYIGIYLQALGSRKVATDSRLEQLNTEFATLARRLDQGLDIFGNQPGWVPHLSVLGTYSQFQALVRQAFDAMFIAYKIRSRWENMKNKVDCFTASREASAQLLDDSQSRLREAQRAYSGIRTDLIEALNAGDRLNGELATLMGEIKNKAKIDAHNRALALGEMRIAFGSLKLISGGLGILTQLIPVGQPVLGTIGNIGSQAAGGAFSALEGLLASALRDDANTTIDSGSQISEQVIKYVKPYQDMILSGIPSGNIDKQISTQKKALKSLGKETTSLARDKQALQALLAIPEDKISEQLERLYRLDGEQSPEDKKQLADWLRQKTSERITALESMGDTAADVIKQLRIKQDDADAIAANVASLSKKKKQHQTAMKNTLQSLLKMPGEIESIANGVRLMCISSDALEPKISAEIETLSGTIYREQLLDLKNKILQLGLCKEECMRRLEHCGALMQDAASTVARCFADIDYFDHSLLGLADALENSAHSSLLAMEQRARATLVEQLYYFAKAYQYRFLKKVDPDFYLLDEFVEQLEEILGYRLPDEADEQAVEKTHLSKDDFELMYDLLEDRLQELVLPLTTDIQHNRKMQETPWLIHARKLFSEKEFEKLNTPIANQPGAETRYQPLVFNLVKSGFAKSDAIKLRIVELKLKSIVLSDIEQYEHGLTFGLRFEHSGTSILLDEQKQNYIFRSQAPSENICWEYTNSIDENGEIVISRVTASTVDIELFRKLTSADDSAAKLLATYRPGASSDITLQRFGRGKTIGGEISDFVIEVVLESWK